MGRNYRADDCVNTAAHLAQETVHDLLEYVTRRAKREGWSVEKLQDELYGYYEEAPCDSSPSTLT